MTVFYAYAHSIHENNTARIVLVFGSREIADEWWRALSVSSFAGPHVKRISPQFYTHDASKCNLLHFFSDSNFKPVSEPFRHLLFITLQDDGGGRRLSIIPPQNIVDHVSGQQFYVQSNSGQTFNWYYNPVNGNIEASCVHRTRFRITANNLPDGAIMIGSYEITIHIEGSKHAQVNDQGVLVAVQGGYSKPLKFSDIGRISETTTTAGGPVAGQMHDLGLALHYYKEAASGMPNPYRLN